MIKPNKQLIAKIASAKPIDLIHGTFPGIKYINQDSTREASAEPTCIEIYPNFIHIPGSPSMHIDIASRKAILLHEVGHYWVDEVMDYLGKHEPGQLRQIWLGPHPLLLKIVEGHRLFIFYDTKIIEALADAFAAYHGLKRNRDYFKVTYPAAYKWLLPYFKKIEFTCPVKNMLINTKDQG